MPRSHIPSINHDPHIIQQFAFLMIWYKMFSAAYFQNCKTKILLKIQK